MDIRYVKVGESHVAYRVFGEGPPDFLLFTGELLSIDAPDEEPRYARSLRRLSSFGRVIMYNPVGLGLSDASDQVATIDSHSEDAAAVLDAVGSARAVAMGWNIAGPSAIRFATKHANRTSALVLINTFARLLADTDYEGLPENLVLETAQRTTDTGTETIPAEFDFLSMFAPSVAKDKQFRAWWDQAGHRGASPANALRQWELMMRADVRDDLAVVSVPTLVVHRADVYGPPSMLGRYLAEHIQGARYVELPGNDLMWWVGDSDSVLDEIEVFVRSAGPSPRPRRKLATVMFVDVVGSTEHAASMGDSRWKALLATFRELVARNLGRFQGKEVTTTGDGVLAIFEMPADAVRCARDVAGQVGALGIEVRAGVHTGEIELLGDDITGIAVHLAARVTDAAGPREVLVTRTVTELVAGSNIVFSEKGTHALKGVPGEWPLFAVSD